jgi:glucokinase
LLIEVQSLMPKAAAIGIDVGGTKTLFALFDDSFELVDSIKERTETEKDAFTSNLTAKVSGLLKKADKSGLTVKALGAGVAGDVHTDKGLVRSAPNIPALEDFSFKKALARLTDLEVGVYNDVNAALYGEHKFGAAVGYKHVIGVFIGTGIGGAVIIGGKLYLGATGHAGDIGNYLVQPFGPLAGSARQGVLDDIASRTAIAGQAATLAAKQWAPNLLAAVGTDVQKIKSTALAAAIKAGDDTIEELVRSRAQIVGIVLSNLVDFLNPELIVLGGGLTDAMPELIRDSVDAGIQGHATENARKAVKVVVAQLSDHAVTTGAAKLALDLAE